MRGVPRLPQASASSPPAVKSSQVKVVVVLLPFVPVIPMMLPFRNRDANSISPQTVTPAFRAARMGGMSSGTPGLTRTLSAEVQEASWSPPSSSRALRRPSSATCAERPSVRASLRTTSPPRASRKRVSATPLRPAPTTTNRRPDTGSINARSDGLGGTAPPAIPPPDRAPRLPQLQGREADQSEDERDDPEPDDHLRLRPAGQLEMMVQGRHPKDPPAARLERRDLEDHRHRLHDEQAADEDQQDLLLDEHGHGPHGAAE